MNQKQNTKETKEDQYLISLSYQSWDEEGIEIGETNDVGMIFHKEIYNLEDLIELVNKHGIDNPSVSNPNVPASTFFSSSEPEQNRDYYEKGIEKYYSLHIHARNGQELSPDELVNIAQQIGIRFDQPPTNKMRPK